MEMANQTLSAPVSWVIAAAVWAILFVVIWETLKQASIFSGPASFVLSVAASLLAVLGMFGRFSRASGQPDTSPGRDTTEFVLLPYAAMGIAILAVLLLLLLARLFGFGKGTRGDDRRTGFDKKDGALRWREISRSQQGGRASSQAICRARPRE